MSENGNQSREWSSRFGYIMVAAGAAIGLGNIWKFPYLAYQGGGGVFLVVYILIVAVMAHPMVEMETAIGRHSASDTVTCFERINKKWGLMLNERIVSIIETYDEEGLNIDIEIGNNIPTLIEKIKRKMR